MQKEKSNSESNELNSKYFGRPLDAESYLKDRLIIQHLRKHKNNFLVDYDEKLHGTDTSDWESKDA